jgi:hypothetical protein
VNETNYIYEEVDEMPKIGVEQTLTNVQQALQERGYEVVPLKQESDAKGCDCCVVSGQDVNVMGISNVVTSGSVIDARGLSAEEVCQAVEERIK